MAIVDFAQSAEHTFRLLDDDTHLNYVRFVEGLNSVKLIYTDDTEPSWNNPYNMPVFDIDFMAITGSQGSNPADFAVESITEGQYNSHVDGAWNSVSSDRIFVVRSSEFATIGYSTTFAEEDIDPDLLWRDDPSATHETDYPTWWGNSFVRLWQPGQFVQFFFTLTAADVNLMNRGDIGTVDPGIFGPNLLLRCRYTGDDGPQALGLNVNNRGLLINGTGGTWTTLATDESFGTAQVQINTNIPQRENIAPSFIATDIADGQFQLTETSTVNADGLGPITSRLWRWRLRDSEGNYGPYITSTFANPVLSGNIAEVEYRAFNYWGQTRPITDTVLSHGAEFTWTPTSPNANDEITFDASETPGAGPLWDRIESYTWDFNGEHTEVVTYQELEVNPFYVPASVFSNYTFTTNGNKTVTLTVLYFDSQVRSVSHVIAVGAGGTVVNFTWRQISSGNTTNIVPEYLYVPGLDMFRLLVSMSGVAADGAYIGQTWQPVNSLYVPYCTGEAVRLIVAGSKDNGETLSFRLRRSANLSGTFNYTMDASPEEFDIRWLHGIPLASTGEVITLEAMVSGGRSSVLTVGAALLPRAVLLDATTTGSMTVV